MTSRAQFQNFSELLSNVNKRQEKNSVGNEAKASPAWMP